METVDQVKVVVVGFAGVGKTSIIKYSISQEAPTDPSPTIGTGFFKLTLDVDNRPLTFEIWDTAGQERFRALTRSFFKGAHAALFVFDLTNPDTLRELDFYAENLKDVCGPGYAVIGLIGNKSDLDAEHRVPRTMIEEYRERLHAAFFLETSAWTGEGIGQIFPALTQQPGIRRGSVTPPVGVAVVQAPARPCRC
jgi:small GTP-binding protein